MKKLMVFDVDGTLIDTELGSFKDLGVMLGKEKEAREKADFVVDKKDLREILKFID